MSDIPTEDDNSACCDKGDELAFASLKSEAEDPIDSQSTHKKKPRGLKRKTCTYVDHDQKADEEDIQMAAELAWSGSTRRRSSDNDLDYHIKTNAGRHSVTYDDIAPPPIAWQKTEKSQMNATYKHKHKFAKMKHTDIGYHRPYDFPPPVVKCTIPESLLDYVDPNVEASEKRGIVKMQLSEKDGKNLPQTKKRKKRKKQTLYWENRLKQQAAQQENQFIKPSVVCRFYLSGNCKKGDECSFSHVGEVQKKADLCKYYLKGACTKKSDCAFYHGDWPCKFFHKFNFCMNGDSCRFSHLPLTDVTRALLEKSLQMNAAEEPQISEPSTIESPPINVKLYKLHEIEIDQLVAMRGAPDFDGGDLRWANDPRAQRRSPSSETQHGAAGWGITITQHIRPIPFLADELYNFGHTQHVKVEFDPPNGDVKSEPPVNGIEFYSNLSQTDDNNKGLSASVISNVDVVVPNAVCTGTGSDSEIKPATGLVIGARHFMHHNVNWMSSRSVVRLKSSAASCSDAK